MSLVHVINPLLAGFLAVFAFQTFKEFGRHRARAMSERYRSEAIALLEAIVSDADEDSREERFARALMGTIGSRSSMRDAAARQVQFFEMDDAEKAHEKEEAEAFRESFSREWRVRFERVFPAIMTACILQDAYLGPEIAKALRKARRVVEAKAREKGTLHVEGFSRPSIVAKGPPLSFGDPEDLYGKACMAGH